MLYGGIAYLAMFPGIYDYDSIDQTLQFLVTGNVSGHHPVLHSLLLSGFMKSDMLFFIVMNWVRDIYTFTGIVFGICGDESCMVFVAKRL